MTSETLSPWMSGKDILAHICRVNGCSETEAIARLHEAILRRDIWAFFEGREAPGFLGKNHPLNFHLLPMGPGGSPMVTVDVRRLLWPTAKFRPDGKVRFSPARKWFEFEAKRDDVLAHWPAQSLRAVNVVQFADRSKGGRPTVYDEVAAILDRLYASNPTVIDKPFKKLADDIRTKAGKTKSDDGWAENTLRDHFRRWRQSKSPSE
jgi:hypothetical protein